MPGDIALITASTISSSGNPLLKPCLIWRAKLEKVFLPRLTNLASHLEVLVPWVRCRIVGYALWWQPSWDSAFNSSFLLFVVLILFLFLTNGSWKTSISFNILSSSSPCFFDCSSTCLIVPASHTAWSSEVLSCRWSKSAIPLSSSSSNSSLCM